MIEWLTEPFIFSNWMVISLALFLIVSFSHASSKAAEVGLYAWEMNKKVEELERIIKDNDLKRKQHNY